MNNKPILYASAPTIAGIKESITDFYCGAEITIDGETVSNRNGLIKGVRVVQKKGRYRFEGMPT